ncbi:MAG: CRTAC1 family protein [Alphaproteobacteria bacterium]
MMRAVTRRGDGQEPALKRRTGIGLVAGLCVAAAALGTGVAQTPTVVVFPDPDPGARSLPSRRDAQVKTAGAFTVFHGFTLTDQLPSTGIRFVNRVVDDAARTFKAGHYDHGTGLAAADVDGDGFVDLYFVSQRGGNQLWRNLGNGRFEDVTARAGVALADRVSVTASFADIDNDGDADLFVTSVRGGNALLANDGHGVFRDVTAQAGVGLVKHSSGAVFLDYDRDGLVDLFVCNVGKYTTDARGPDGAYIGIDNAFVGFHFPDRFEEPVLYRNRGQGRFEDVTAAVGLHPHGWAGDAIATDVNRDGWPDLFVLNMSGPQHYLENQAGKTFVDRTKQYFPRGPMGAMGAATLDVDNDGRLDLFLTDMHVDMADLAGMTEQKETLKSPGPPGSELPGMGHTADFIFGNALYQQRADGGFAEVSDALGVETYWPWGTSAGDLNADGWMDLFVTGSMSYPFRYHINSMLLNNAGRRFLPAEFLLGIEPRRNGRTHVPWHVEPACTPGERRRLPSVAGHPCDGQTGAVQVMGALGSRSSVLVDLDNDGDLDIVTNEHNAEPQVLVSNLSAARTVRWLKVALVGTRSNRAGLGATVRVTAGGRTLTQLHNGKSGYLSQSATPLYFGLDDATGVDRLEVVWPSGNSQTVAVGRGINRVVTVTERR